MASLDPDHCEASCVRRTLNLTAPNLGSDKGERAGSNADARESLLSFLRERRAAESATLKPIRIADLAMAIERGPIPPTVILHKSGHLWLLVGRLDVTSDTLCHLVHGDRPGALVPVSEISRGRFDEAWQLSAGGHAAQFHVGSGRFEVDTLLKDFGEIQQGQRLDCRFELRNSGENDLILTKPTTSCSCTTTSVADRTVMRPGETQSLEVAMRSNNHPAQRQTVRFNVVEKGSGASRTVELLLFAQQRNSMLVAPSSVDFGEVENQKSYTRSLSVTEAATDRCSVQRLEVHGAPLNGNASAPTIDEDGLSCYRVRLQLTPGGGLGSGKHTREVVLFTTSAAHPIVKIPVQFEIAPKIRVVPSVLTFGSIACGDTVRRSVAIMSRDSTAPDVAPLYVPDDCSLSFSKENGTTMMTVSATPGKSGIWQRTIKLSARHSDATEVLEVLCSAYAR